MVAFQVSEARTVMDWMLVSFLSYVFPKMMVYGGRACGR